MIYETRYPNDAVGFRTDMPTVLLRSDITEGSGLPETGPIGSRTADILG